MNIYREIPPTQKTNNFVSLDVEMFRMNKKQLHRPNSGRFACLTICPNDEDVYIITDEKQVQQALDTISDAVWVTQNGKFDIVQLRRYATIEPRKKWWDTLYIEKIMYGGYYDRFGLDDLARRYLNISVDKSMQKYFEKNDELNDEAIQYACFDSLITRKIALKQRDEIDKESFNNIWKGVDMPFAWATMAFRGFPINPERIKEWTEENIKSAEEIAVTLPFNPRSWKQILEWARVNKIKISATDETTLREYIEKNPGSDASGVFGNTIKARYHYHMASTYGTNILNEFMEYESYPEYHDGAYPVVYPNININEAETGRTSATDPNIQNQPTLKRVRSNYQAADGFDLIIADYSGQEPTITAFVTQDEKLLKIFREGKDVYIEMYYEIFGERLTGKKDPRRKTMKDVFLGMVYGLTKWGFSKKYGVSLEEADELLTKSIRTFKGVVAWQEKQFKFKRFVKTVLGRRIWINPWTYQADRNKLNAPIQGTAADMMKKAIAKMFFEWPFEEYPFAVCAPVHDECVLHVPKTISKKVALFVKETMEKVAEEMCPGVPFIADVTIGNSWADKE